MIGRSLTPLLGPLKALRHRSRELAAILRWFVWSLRLGRLGRKSRVSRDARIYAPSCVEIGFDVHLNDFVHIWGAGGVTIGDHVLLASHVVVTSQSHDVDAFSQGSLYRETEHNLPVVIGRNVWIGSGAIVLPGVNIGENSVVAAGAVVTKSVPPCSLVMGTPAKVVRSLATG